MSKKATLEETIAQIHKQYGDGSCVKFSQDALPDIDVISTGSMSLDLALGVGGIPKGRITEIFGPPSAGKTTVCGHVIANAQKAGGKAVFIDVEHALDPKYMRDIGVDIDELYICQPNSGEEALNIAEAFVKSGEMDVVVIDSVAALVPRAEIDGEMGDSHIGLQARLMGQALRKLNGPVGVSNCALIFTNQVREKVGVMFGSPETTSGGKSLPFYASVRMRISRVGQPKTEGGVATSSTARVKVVKNKVAPPFTECEFQIVYGEGISYEGGLVDVAVLKGIVEKRGSWFKYNDEMLGQGMEATCKVLKSKPELCEEIANKVREVM